MAYLNETGLAHFWAKLKGKFLPVTGGTVTGSLAVTGKLSVGEMRLPTMWPNPGQAANGSISNILPALPCCGAT